MHQKRPVAVSVVIRARRRVSRWGSRLCRALLSEAAQLRTLEGGARFAGDCLIIALLSLLLWLCGGALGPALVGASDMGWAEALRFETPGDQALPMLAAWLAAAACLALVRRRAAWRPARIGTRYAEILGRILLLQSPALLLAIAALVLSTEPGRVLKRLEAGMALALFTALLALLIERSPLRHRGRRALRQAAGATLFAAAAWMAWNSTWWSDYGEYRHRTASALKDPRLDPTMADRAAAVLKDVNARTDGNWWLGARDDWRFTEIQTGMLTEGPRPHKRYQEGRSVDLVFWVRGEGWSRAPDLPWHLVGQAAKAHGLLCSYPPRAPQGLPRVKLPEARGALERAPRGRTQSPGASSRSR